VLYRQQFSELAHGTGRHGNDPITTSSQATCLHISRSHPAAGLRLVDHQPRASGGTGRDPDYCHYPIPYGHAGGALASRPTAPARSNAPARGGTVPYFRSHRYPVASAFAISHAIPFPYRHDPATYSYAVTRPARAIRHACDVSHFHFYSNCVPNDYCLRRKKWEA
jgi:hypothetical protein